MGLSSVYNPNVAGNFICDDEKLLPVRKTVGSAGYDFVSPITITIPPHRFVHFDSGVRVKMNDGFVLQLFIRSSLGKRGITLTNSVGIIDSDYQHTIQAFIFNTSDEEYVIHEGDRYMQGIFTKYYITENDETTEERIGGLGSTGK